MTSFDDKIKHALLSESDSVWKEAEEENLFEQALGVMKGTQKFIIAIVYIGMFFLMGGMIYCGFQFFDAETTRAQIAWAVGFGWAGLGMGMLKLWFWMQMDKNAIVREVKRLELQIATLAGIIKHQGEE